MTAQILTSELNSLIQESKRRNNELRNAAEKSLQDLKALPATSEAQLAGDLSRRPYFISPFLVACGTHNAKYATSAVICLQRLAVIRALPRERLKDVLESLKECSTLALDAQLKVLQTLPALLQNYTDDFKGDLLSSILQICFALQSVKTPAVSSTATATLQQLVISVFDKVVSEDRRSVELPTVDEVSGESGPIRVRAAAHDAYGVFYDLCVLIEGGKPQFVRVAPIPQGSGLELIEAVLSNHAELFLAHSEQANILRTILLPFINRCLSAKISFPIAVRVIRVLDIIVRQLLSLAPTECETSLDLLNRMLDVDAGSSWKRALCMELFQSIYRDPALLLDVYSRFDRESGKRTIIQDNLAALVRMSAEKPTLIGLGNQSTAPANSLPQRDTVAEQAAVEAGGVAGVIGAAVGTSPSSVTGISSQWSTPRIPCLEQLDKSDPPALPDTYVYSLVLLSISSLSEGLAKFTLPLTVQSDGRNKKKAKTRDEGADDTPASPTPERAPQQSNGGHLSRSQSYRRRTVPPNPLSMEDHPAHSKIVTAAAIIDDCWPAVLASCSTYLHASLDAEYYRALVRSIQKFTQTAGLLRAATPRDTFLTMLGKAAVPAGVLTTMVTSSGPDTVQGPGIFANAKGLLSVDSLVSQTSGPSDNTRRLSVDLQTPSLSVRNLLCLRALLNLAIALGPILEASWAIVLETLLNADVVMAAVNGKFGSRDGRSGRVDDGTSSMPTVASEIAAVEAAAGRLFESTVDFPNDTFVHLLTALCNTFHEKHVSGPQSAQSSPPPTPMHLHRRVTSFSGTTINSDANTQSYLFALRKIGDMAMLNLARFATNDTEETGWDLVINELTMVASRTVLPKAPRLLATEIITRTIHDMMSLSVSEEGEVRNAIQRRSLSALRLNDLYIRASMELPDTVDETTFEVHGLALETLRLILEHCGESITAGWDTVFDVLLSAFESYELPAAIMQADYDTPQQHESPEFISITLGRTAFGSVQLICSDFLEAIPDTSLVQLVDTLFRFCAQDEDLNISLTTTTFFWNVSDFLQDKMSPDSLEHLTTDSFDKTGLVQAQEVVALEQPLASIWLHLLLRLTAVTTDDRPEVRNGAVHTILRIFNNCGDRLTPSNWELCLQRVLFQMLKMNVRLQAIHQPSSRDRHSHGKDSNAHIIFRKSLNETTKVILNGLGDLLSNYLDKIVRAPCFSDLWQTLMSSFGSYLSYGSHELNAAVFSTLTHIVGRFDNNKTKSTGYVDRVSTLWIECFPVSAPGAENDNNQDAFVSYVQLLKELYRLTQDLLDDYAVAKTAANLERCIRESDSLAYSTDVDSMTPLQAQVIEYFAMVRLDKRDVAPNIVKSLATFIILPFEATNKESKPRTLTFVALSKASMDLLRSLVVQTIDRDEMIESGAFLSALASLEQTIQRKYTWHAEGKTPPMWQKATSVALAVLAPALDKMKQSSIDESFMRPIWDEVVKIADGIAKADYASAPPTTPILDHEAFDIDAATTIRDLIIPALGHPHIPDSTRRAYTSSLFRHSLIHSPEPGEIPSPDASPLQGLYSIRLGRTYDPPPTQRLSVSYFCLSQLLALVAVTDGSDARIRLAQAAAPYLILRAALPLKAYIADQPLRGRMPQPWTQREELLFVLRRMRELESEPRAIPDAPGVVSKFKKHLHRLFPLVTRALGVARGDEEVLEALRGVVEVVGEGFGV